MLGRIMYLSPDHWCWQFFFFANKDQEDYKKADKDAYLKLADKLDAAGFDEISIEDAHRHNDLSLFKHFKKSKVT